MDCYFTQAGKLWSHRMGLASVAYSDSAVSQDRYHVMPRDVSIDLTWRIFFAGYASAVRQINLSASNWRRACCTDRRRSVFDVLDAAKNL
jgi:hypothetical protein